MPHTLLLADDSVTIQRVIELTFADEDVKVVAVSDGDQAIARLDAQPPDIVLADVGMPGKNGYEVAQYIKQSPRLAHIPVVLLTGAFEPVDQARAAQAGCDGVLAKPFEPQLVIGRVRELLGQGKAAPATADAHPPAHPLDAAIAAPTTPPVQASTGDLTNYFDRLDAAFANLSHPSDGPGASAEIASLADVSSAASASSASATATAEADWFGTPPGITEQPAPDLPLSYASSQAAFDVAPTPAFDAVPAAAERAPIAPQAPVALMAPETEVAPMAPEPKVAPQALVAPEAPEAPEALEALEGRAAPVAREAPAMRLPEKPVALPPLADAFAALLAAERGEAPPDVAWAANLTPPAPPSVDAIAEKVSAHVLESISPRIDASVRAAVADLVSQLAERLIHEEIERIKATIK